ncbi:hypothetical protein VKT23_011072 [Stygiomarasmius scandens]|uniref:Heterokaryon incompatibility domain-containing protein n=1 Tax=Marasmiellus scandens TaxID=2682957 RepID=A0ABR1JAM2_9AGAR
MSTSQAPYPSRLNPALREIRLLHLHPGPPESPIRCHLTTASLLSSPTYEALSYVWGDPSNPPTIILHGSPFPVTRNLYTALRYLRRESQERILWIDALVINQADVEERNSQVSMMDAVYSSASAVSIWLGEEEEGSDDAFDVLLEIAEGRLVDAERQIETLKFFFRIVERPWFTRMWIMQELALARVDPQVGCGYKWLSWNRLMETWRTLRQTGFTHEYIGLPERRWKKRAKDEEHEDVVVMKLKFDTLDDMRQAVYKQGGEILNKLILISKSSLATEPRDRIYALLGMMKEEDREAIAVDYRKPVPVVYAEAMAHIFEKGQGPFFLSGMFLQGIPSPPGWPSWVPDFAAQCATSRYNSKQISGDWFHPRHGDGVSGPGADADNGRVLDDMKTLKVEGMFVDVVDEVLLFEQTIDGCLQQLPQVEFLADQAKSRVPRDLTLRDYFSKFKCKESLWQTLVMNRRQGYAKPEIAPQSFENMYEFIRGRCELPPEFEREGSECAEDYVQEYKSNLSNILPKCVFFTTESGFVGLGMPGIQKGDHVTIWFGAPVPFIIRPITSKEGFYNLIGVAYVAGIMDGEMVDEIYCEDLTDAQTFFIL